LLPEDVPQPLKVLFVLRRRLLYLLPVQTVLKLTDCLDEQASAEPLYPPLISSSGPQRAGGPVLPYTGICRTRTYRGPPAETQGGYVRAAFVSRFPRRFLSKLVIKHDWITSVLFDCKRLLPSAFEHHSLDKLLVEFHAVESSTDEFITTSGALPGPPPRQGDGGASPAIFPSFCYGRSISGKGRSSSADLVDEAA
jgi:hypothetical protein